MQTSMGVSAEVISALQEPLSRIFLVSALVSKPAIPGISFSSIVSAKVYSDAMDWRLPQRLEAILPGLPLQKEAVCTAIDGLQADWARDVAQWLRDQWAALL